MTVIVNPFDAGGFTLAEMSAAIQMLPNPYGRVGQLGLFAPEPISQRNVTIESIEGELRLLPSVSLGAPGATAGSRRSSPSIDSMVTLRWDMGSGANSPSWPTRP